MNREELEKELYDKAVEDAKQIATSITTELIGRHNINPGVVAMACQMIQEAIKETTEQAMIDEFGSVEAAISKIDEEMDKRASAMGASSENVVNMAMHKMKKNLH